MSATGAERAAWAEGISAVHQEAAGVVTMQIIRPVEAMELMTAAMLGDNEAARLMALLAETSERIDAAKRTKEPMLCVSCPRRLLDNAFSFIVVGPAGQIATNRHLVFAVCRKCGRSTEDIRRKATSGLRRLWPDLRQVTIHPETGRA